MLLQGKVAKIVKYDLYVKQLKELEALVKVKITERKKNLPGIYIK